MKNYLNKILISFFAVLSLGISQDNYSLSFGDGSHVEIPGSDAYNNLDDFSFSLWMKLNSNDVLANLNNNNATHYIINKDHHPNPSNGTWHLMYWKNTDTGDNYFIFGENGINWVILVLKLRHRSKFGKVVNKFLL